MNNLIIKNKKTIEPILFFVLCDKIEKSIITNVGVPTDDKLVSTVSEKERKYQPLVFELEDICTYKSQKVEIMAVCISANELATRDWQVAKNRNYNLMQNI